MAADLIANVRDRARNDRARAVNPDQACDDHVQ